MNGVLACVSLVLAALVVAWPVRSSRARRRRIHAGANGDSGCEGSVPLRESPGRPGGADVVDGAAGSDRDPGADSATAADRGVGVGEIAAASERGLTSRLRTVRGTDLPTLLAGLADWRGWSVAAALGAVAGFLTGGVTAAAMVSVYGGVAARALGRHLQRRTAARARAEVLDGLGALAADLRAGLPPARTVALPPAGTDPVAARATAAAELAEATGAPLADLIERIEADGRAGDRAAMAAAAQAAGARMTAWLLAALPMAGIGLGIAMGADPLHVLLHTPLGAACAVAATALQLAGLAWSARLATSAVNP